MSTYNIYYTLATLTYVWITCGVKNEIELLQQKPHDLEKPLGSSWKRTHSIPKNGLFFLSNGQSIGVRIPTSFHLNPPFSFLVL